MGDEAIVVGGGIGGLGAALALANSGLAVRLLEQASAFSEVGAGLQVGPNAVRALARLGVLPQILSRASFPEFGVILDAISGETLTRVALQGPMEARFGYPYLVMHRNDVLTALLDACRNHAAITLENNRTVTGVVNGPDEVGVTTSSGIEYTARIVVGADGLNSRVRDLIRIDKPVFSGHVAYRGTVPAVDVKPEDRSDDVRLWLGPDIHLMQYPVRGGELYNQVAVFRSSRYAAGEAEWGTPEELEESFRGASDSARAAIPLLATMRAYPNYDKEPLETFVAGRAVLIGDAAHPMLQYLGQGACQALEDGLVLAEELGGSASEPAEALAAYDSARVPRTTRCQTVARPWGQSWHSSDPVVVAYRNRYFKARATDDYSDVAWLYDDVFELAKETAS